jgi:hypothetical protein
MPRFDKGWIKIHRIPDGHWLLDDPAGRFLWLELLTMATYKETKIKSGTGFKTIEVGSVVTSREELALKTGLGEQIIRSRLESFSKDQMITQQITNRGRVITICNWRKYQERENQENQPITDEQPAENQQITNGKPLSKEYKNIRKYISPVSEETGEPACDEKPKRAEFTEDDAAVAEAWNEWASSVSKTVRYRPDQWATEVAKLVRIDGLSHRDIIEILEFVQNDEFWSRNAISIMSLRSRLKNGLLKWEQIRKSIGSRSNIASIAEHRSRPALKPSTLSIMRDMADAIGTSHDREA